MNLLMNQARQGFRCARLGIAAAALGLCLAAGAAFAGEIADTQLSTPTVLPWISEVVKMNSAGVPQEVIANYVKNTSARSALSADDIIYLHNQNVSTPLITAMIEHGATAPTASPTAPMPLPAAPAPVPGYGYGSTATYAQVPPDYGADQTQPAVNYNYYGSSGYGNGYPYYYSYWNYPYYYYPVWYYPYGYYCWRGGRWCWVGHSGSHGAFHGNFSGGSHGNSGGGFHGSAGGGSHTTSGFSHASFAMGGVGGMGGHGMHR